MHDLPEGKKVLGVIRPTTESINEYTKNGKVGILATEGTVLSNSYRIEINKFFPEIEVFQHACPLWVPLVESNEINSEAARIIIKKDIDQLLAQAEDIDTIVLACTHYPLLLPLIKECTPKNIRILTQGELVAEKLANYLQRHPEVEKNCSKNGTTLFYTTDQASDFERNAEVFFEKKVKAEHLLI